MKAANSLAVIPRFGLSSLSAWLGAQHRLHFEPHVQVQNVAEDEVRSERGPAQRDKAEVRRCVLRLLLLDAAEILVDQRLQGSQKIQCYE